MIWIKKVKVIQSCLTLCDPTDYTVHGILQARILELVAFPLFRGSSQPRDQTQVSLILGGFFTSWATREAQDYPFFKGSSQPRNRTRVSCIAADSLPTDPSEKPDLNKGTLIYSEAEGQGPLNQAIMYDYNNKNNKKQVKETVSHMGKYMGFFYALMLF